MASSVRNLTPEEARRKITEKLRKGGTKGAGSPVTPKMPADKRIVFEQALEEMAATGLIVALPTATKPKYFLREFAPSAETAAVKIERYAESKHPTLLAQTQLKTALSPIEKPFLVQAIQALESQVRLIRLLRGKAFVFAHADSLRAALGVTTKAPIFDPQAVRRAYHTLVTRTGFRDVEIAALQRESGAPLAELKEWLQAEHHDGRADFYFGDWSLSDAQTREGAIELRGERYLLVRLEE
ncbi:MAG: hypothetical protein WDN28_13470 [Chthoniobacter sp.]